MSIIGKLRQLILPRSPGESGREVVAPSPGDMSSISRRTFFSFFGVGAAMLAKPDLFRPKSATEKVFGVYDQPLSMHLAWDDPKIRWVCYLSDDARRMVLAEIAR